MSSLSPAELLAGVRACMKTALKLSDRETAAIDLTTTALQLPGWTSMVHLELVLALESRFDVMFDADEIANLASVAAIVAALEKERPR